MVFRKLLNFKLLLIAIFLLSFKSSFADNKLVMITADYCIYCQIWEKEIGEIYPKTDISKDFPLERIKLDEDSIKNKQPNRIITKKIGRNDACPCGSGKKYKACHGS